MKTVLALETSTDFASVALWHQDAIISSCSFASKHSLSADLFPKLAQMLEKAPAVERIAVGLGPGSYAGVRIGIAAALGLQSVWNCELVGIPSAVAMGTHIESFSVIGDARRGTWYYSKVQKGACTEGPSLLESDDALLHQIAKSPDSIRHAESLPETMRERLTTLATLQYCIPEAAILAQLGATESGIIQREVLEPVYLREPHITRPKTA